MTFSPSRWRFRLGLLDIFGAVTFTALTVWAARLLPANAQEDRIYLVYELTTTIVTLLVGRSLESNGVLWGALGAAIGGGLAMTLFGTRFWYMWYPQETNYLITNASWWSTVEATALAGVMGTLVALSYSSVLNTYRLGPGGVLKLIRSKPLLSSVVFSILVLPLPVLWTIDHIYFGGGLKPRTEIALDETTWFSQGEIPLVLSEGGECWLEREQVKFEDLTNSWKSVAAPWQVCRVRGRRTEKQHVFKAFGTPSLSPDGHHSVFFENELSIAIADTQNGKIVCRLDDCRPRFERLEWLSDGKIVICETDEIKASLSVWSFDGQRGKRERTIPLAVAAFPAAMGSSLEWVAEFVPNGSSVWSDYVVTRVADGRELRRISLRIDGSQFLGDSSSLLLASPDGHWLIDQGKLINIEKGVQVHCEADRLCGFTHNSHVLAIRRPYQSKATSPEKVGFSLEEHASTLPLLRFLPLLEYCDQLIVINPATGKQTDRFRCANGMMSEAYFGKDRRAAATVVSGFSRPRYCGLEHAGQVSSSLVIWDLP